MSPAFWHLHTYCTYHVPTYISRAVASYLDVMWPKSCGHKGTAARGVWGHAPPGNCSWDHFFAKIGTTTTHELDFQNLTTLRHHQFCSYIQVTVWRTTTLACPHAGHAILLGSWRQLKDGSTSWWSTKLTQNWSNTHKTHFRWIGYCQARSYEHCRCINCHQETKSKVWSKK